MLACVGEVLVAPFGGDDLLSNVAVEMAVMPGHGSHLADDLEDPVGTMRALLRAPDPEAVDTSVARPEVEISATGVEAGFP